MRHARASEEFLKDEKRSRRHDAALWHMRMKRDRAAASVPEWEELRSAAQAIKRRTLTHLDRYLLQFEKRALANGIRVHWAEDAREHNEIVFGLLKKNAVERVVKSKSMLTEECGLNGYLEARGVSVVDTDLGERIVQLNGQAPSHIVMPAVHLTREDIADLFGEKLGMGPLPADPDRLTKAARVHLREKFLGAQAGITGVNFAIAETGGIVVVTNEGNADLGTSLPPLHIACMGLEKVIPGLDELAVLVRLLARSASGQAISAYTSHFHGPRANGALHLVIVDNGRSSLLGDGVIGRSLACIRCSACLNSCPVYRRSGGYSYNYVVQGPIGSLLAPARDLKEFRDLPFASSLCGSCTAVCPVKIDIHGMLLGLRERVASRGLGGQRKRFLLRLLRAVLLRRGWYERGGRVLRGLLRLPRFLVYGRYNVWGRDRELPAVPERSFRELYDRMDLEAKRDGES